MFKYLLKGVLSALAIKILNTYRQLSVQLFKIEVAKAYLHGVRMARLSAIGLMGLGLLIALIGVGVLLLHVGLFILLPCTVEAKAVLALVLGLVYVGVGGLTLRAALDEKTWMEKSGAAEMLKEATRPSPKD